MLINFLIGASASIAALVFDSPSFAASSASSPSSAAASRIWQFDLKQDDSIFAIVTHKAGLAAKLAHNHLVAARQFSATLAADPNKLNEGQFSFKANVNELEFDRPDLQKRWFPLIQALNWLTEPYNALSDSDRETIREHGLAADQLDAQKFKEVSATIESITDAKSKLGSKDFNKRATVAVTIKGQTVKRVFATNMNLQGQELNVEAAADFKFSEFGIKPYRALMGALGNDDVFNILVSFRAVKK